MPLYEYLCPKCGHEEEQWLKISEKNKATCSKCNTLTNITPSLCGFKLTGTGWYVTDYPKENKPKNKKDKG